MMNNKTTDNINISALARAVKMNPGTIRSRLERGISLYDAISLPEKSKSKGVVYDHLGQEYPSLNAMCRTYHINRRTFEKRQESGMTIEEILTVPVNHKCGPKKITKDHDGNVFDSIGAKCAHYGINYNLYLLRKRKGWSEEQALTTPVRKSDLPKISGVVDHLGQTYPTLNAMCRHYNIERTLFIVRRNNGWSIEKALTVPVKTYCS